MERRLDFVLQTREAGILVCGGDPTLFTVWSEDSARGGSTCKPGLIVDDVAGDSEFYRSEEGEGDSPGSWKVTGSDICTGTGCPSFVPGLNVCCFTASRAASSSIS